MAIIDYVLETTSQLSVLLPCADPRISEVSSGGYRNCPCRVICRLPGISRSHHGTSLRCSVVERQIGHGHGVRQVLAGGQVKLAGSLRITQTREPDGRGNSSLALFGSATRPGCDASHMTLGLGLFLTIT